MPPFSSRTMIISVPATRSFFSGAVNAGITQSSIPNNVGLIEDAIGRPLNVLNRSEIPPDTQDSIATGYWNKHEDTKNTFHGHWINTHDKFMVDPDGYFWYAGRADDMMKVSGLAVWPADVEAVKAQSDQLATILKAAEPSLASCWIGSRNATARWPAFEAPIELVAVCVTGAVRRRCGRLPRPSFGTP